MTDTDQPGEDMAAEPEHEDPAAQVRAWVAKSQARTERNRQSIEEWNEQERQRRKKEAEQRQQDAEALKQQQQQTREAGHQKILQALDDASRPPGPGPGGDAPPEADDKQD